ncbi:LOW QUALITY PROTEIN: laminin subunit alpha-2 [Lethenteron reissneri]|uniref:LOW QUALITY PROTEIN: laminin subunit alpha-2 n=1 Tax=Lethenteron reissneri TaxID=7753 RepID=UPI002AB610F1|nr:LOW QUALITY PROTEIN: laminin subunit alpha-2 [Lethenteron reissneri]
MKARECALLLLLVTCAACAGFTEAQQRGLFPAIFNLASNSEITANATCGVREPETYCKLVEHVPGRPFRNPQCRLCDQRSANPAERHSIQHAIDGTNSWWQSPSIQNGVQYHWVTITLDLRQVFQIAYVILKAANSPRPGSWVLERSLDGVAYTPWQYYAVTDADCLIRYSVMPTIGNPTYRRDDEVICTSYYSRLVPLENGEIHTSMINGRPSADDPSPALMEFTSARFIRFSFQRIRTLNADLMTLNHHGPQELDPIVTRRYYYSVKDISVGGMCICYGHARACLYDSSTKKHTCQCEHNTCGESCNRCCPGYHQMSWQPGTVASGNLCEKCNCHGKAGECYYDPDVARRNLSLNTAGKFVGGGVCLNCSQNTAGVNCESCVDEFFRPPKVRPTDPNPCRPCNCNPVGSVSKVCVKDDKESSSAGGLAPGSCRCKPGYGGERCNRCAFGYKGFPNCVKCKCSTEGSINKDPCKEPCVCKSNVQGKHCDSCKPGHYNLQESNALGCTECFCFGVTRMCDSIPWARAKVSDMSGWRLMDRRGEQAMLPTQDRFDGPLQLSVNNTMARRVLPASYYWAASSPYLGNKLTAYGGELSFTLSYDLPPDMFAPAVRARLEVILEGVGQHLVWHGEEAPMNPFEEQQVSLRLLPSSFAAGVTQHDLMTVLTDLAAVLIRVPYSSEPHAVYRLSSVTLEVAAEGMRGAVAASDVELCQCPPGYSGTSCEISEELDVSDTALHQAPLETACVRGHRRVNGSLYAGACEPCDCHGHATECDDVSGNCLNCEHNSVGPRCERCLPGFYGNAQEGTPHDCQPCACPLSIPSNNFSPTCRVGPSGAMLCDRCAPGYAGARCDRCDDGYYGSPGVPGSTCQPCQCNGNVDLSTPGACDAVTGECLRCVGHTSGRHCERCATGYFGDAIVAKNCQPCKCSSNGSQSNTCDAVTGQCECKPNVAGRQCDHCVPNCWWDAQQRKCQPCRCSLEGAASSTCDKHGRCACRPEFSGKRCEFNKQLLQQQQNSLAGGCPRGSYRRAGLPHAGGARHYGMSQPTGCAPCNCNSFGAFSFDCDESGQCHCQPGVVGRQCDRCAPGYYDFKEGGCTRCECDHTGHNCDAVSGRCICPPNTEGARCDRCSPNCWGHDPAHGCQHCECSPVGTLSPQCDQRSGRCDCRPEYSGEKCGECRHGFYGYPRCAQCRCDPAGTRADACDAVSGSCSCSEPAGQCPCKPNAHGLKCDACGPGMFGLHAGNPQGCSQCFCFGVSSECSEALGLVRQEVTLGHEQAVLPVVDQAALRETTRGVRYQRPDVVVSADEALLELPGEPFYWRLPKQFLGHKLSAYGGTLRYSFSFEAREEVGPSSHEPLVIIKGARNHVVIAYQERGPPTAQRAEHAVALVEYNWKYFSGGSEHAVSRSDFLSVINDIDYILIRASHGRQMRQSRISGIALEVGVEENGNSLSERARQIERCVCPTGYSGLSCQECSEGYFRQSGMELTVRGARPHHVVPPCVACQCHGHSGSCDADTGKCLNCQHNTAGAHCELCQPGFYGVVRGSPGDCRRCACPSQDPGNNFSPTCVTVGQSDYFCDACAEGYEGPRCEKCAAGFYGDPMSPGGSCQPCGCHVAGSTHHPCNPHTGQCSCRPGVMGRLCDSCMPRHVLVASRCLSCDDECTGVLLSDLDSMGQLLMSVNVTGTIPAPYPRLTAMENATHLLKHQLSPQRDPTRLLTVAETNLGGLVTEMDQLLNRTTQVYADGEQVDKDTNRTLARAQEVDTFVRKTATAAEALVENARQLNAVLSGHDGSPEGNLPQIKADIGRMLQEMRARRLVEPLAAARGEHKEAEELLARVQQEFAEPHGENQKRASEAEATLGAHGDRLRDAESLLAQAQGKIRDSDRLSEANLRTIGQLDGKRKLVEDGRKEADKALEDGQSMVEAARGQADAVVDGLDRLDEQKDELEAAAGRLQLHVDALVREIGDRGLPLLVDRAANHSAHLQEAANRLAGILADAKNVSFNATAAVKAYTKIKGNIDEAERLAREAGDVAHDAHRMASGPGLDGSLKDAAKSSLQQSFGLNNEAKKLGKQVDGLKNQTGGVSDRIAKGNQEQKELERRLNDAVAMLRMIPNDTGAKIAQAKDKARMANESAGALLAETKDLNKQLAKINEDYNKLNQDTRKTNDFINDSGKNIAEAADKAKAVDDEVNRLLEKLKPIQVLESNLNKNLSQIKNLINQARKQAASIKVSVASGGSCVRTYHADIKKGKYNTVTLNVKTTVPDNLLFYLASANTTDFMAIEMRHGRVVFQWDVGSGVGKVDYPELEIHNNVWYRIDAERSGISGSLSVKALVGGREPTKQTGQSPKGYTILDVDSNAKLFVGGFPGTTVKKHDTVKFTAFTGCMGEAFLDGKSIGLWNFRSTGGDCSGCVVSPQPKEDEGTVQFDGEGYSAAPRPMRWNVNTTVLVFKFRTFAANALLLYSATKDTKDFLSVELVEGQVRVMYDLGSGVGRISTSRRYNDGTWKSLNFGRNGKTGRLRLVDIRDSKQTEEMAGSSPGGATGLNLQSKDKIYIGGIPNGHNASVRVRSELASRNFAGCLRDVEIAGSFHGLLRSQDSLGIRKGCALDAAHSVSLQDKGFVELPSLESATLGVDADVSLSFSTLNRTGLLLLGLGAGRVGRPRRQATAPHYAVMLLNGRVMFHVQVPDGSQAFVSAQPSAGIFYDGKDHSLTVSRRKGFIKVQVDEDNSEETVFASTASVRVQKMYVGGVPPSVPPTLLKTTQSFQGCIRNLIVNSVLADFANQVTFDKADIGKCVSFEPKEGGTRGNEKSAELEPLPSSPRVTASPPVAGARPTRGPAPGSYPEPDAPQRKPPARRPSTPVAPPAVVATAAPPVTATAGQCAAHVSPVTLGGAKQFGVSRNSHTAFAFNDTTVKKELVISLELRTLAKNGLVFYMARINHADFFTLQIKEGKLHFSFDLGRGASTKHIPRTVNDGKWHSVRITRKNERASLTLDKTYGVTVQGPSSATILDVVGMMYVGGVPQNYTLRRIGNVTNSIPGCIKNFVMNGKQLDMDKPTSSYRVEVCYVNPQEGSYFDGTGYAQLAESAYKVGTDFEVVLEFRSVQSNGVLLGISHNKMSDAVGLELVDGKLLFSADNGPGRFTAVYDPGTGGSLCDGRWHAVSAKKIKHQLELRVDGAMVTAQSSVKSSTSADTNRPVYLGGFPADSVQFALSSKTPFQGCMRRLQLVRPQQTLPVDLAKAASLRGVQPLACPSQ